MGTAKAILWVRQIPTGFEPARPTASAATPTTKPLLSWTVRLKPDGMDGVASMLECVLLADTMADSTAAVAAEEEEAPRLRFAE